MCAKLSFVYKILAQSKKSRKDHAITWILRKIQNSIKFEHTHTHIRTFFSEPFFWTFAIILSVLTWKSWTRIVSRKQSFLYEEEIQKKRSTNKDNVFESRRWRLGNHHWKGSPPKNKNILWIFVMDLQNLAHATERGILCTECLLWIHVECVDAKKWHVCSWILQLNISLNILSDFLQVPLFVPSTLNNNNDNSNNNNNNCVAREFSIQNSSPGDENFR